MADKSRSGESGSNGSGITGSGSRGSASRGATGSGSAASGSAGSASALAVDAATVTGAPARAEGAGQLRLPRTVAVVSTYPPRPCGIGVFASDLRTALLGTDTDLDVLVVPIVNEPTGARDLTAAEPGRETRVRTIAAGGQVALTDSDGALALALPEREPEPAPLVDDRDEVLVPLRQHRLDDYAAVARAISESDAEVVLLEHEYGIYGGDCGEYVVSLVEQIRQPVVVTLHTVLSEPSPQQARTLAALCARADLVTVFTETARRMMIGAGVVEPERIRVVPHGAPGVLLDRALAERGVTAKNRDEASTLEAVRGRAARSHRRRGDNRPTDLTLRRLEGRTVLSTFGLISSGKGIEFAIQALPAVVERHPEVVYLIAGQTHPEVVRHEGESYRDRLESLVDELDLRDHVQFLDRFLTIDELADLLAGTDLYLTPYRSREQIVSGALTFAVAAGCPVVSTPYFYAEDLLGSGAGRLVPFGDPAAMADAVNALLDDPDALAAARAEATRIGAGLSWTSVGRQTVEVLAQARTVAPRDRWGRRPDASADVRVRVDQLAALVDDVGIVQHANGVIPRRSSGYCVDDVARMVLVGLELASRDGAGRSADLDPERALISTGLSFLEHAWRSDLGGMHNFMGYDRRWLDDAGLGDHVGRAAWALGAVVAEGTRISGPSRTAHPRARAAVRLLEELEPLLGSADSPRTVAFAVLGLAAADQARLPRTLARLLETLGLRLAEAYDRHAGPGWSWFEPYLTYDNARLPQALIAAGHRLGDDGLLSRGLTALDWYVEQCARPAGGIRLVGNRWRQAGDLAGEHTDDGDEQPLDAAALVECLVTAAEATGDSSYAERAAEAFSWFLGNNRWGRPVYDARSGGCRDGLGPLGVNDNEGAESTLAFWQAALAVERTGLVRVLD